MVGIGGDVPDPADFANATDRKAAAAALEYMGLKPGTPITDMPVDRVFIGSCTNGRIEDLRAAAAVVRGHRVADGVQAMVVPGSGLVKRQAEAEGLDKIFRAAGFEWREAGCSMCLAMNPDKLEPGERCASTSNRNFEGRQGKGGRTHLVSPAMAAAAAVAGHFVDIRESGNDKMRRPQCEPFHSAHTGLVLPMDRSNVDTDQIIPKQFLKRIERTGFGQFLFFDWRFLDDGSANPDFVLNRPRVRRGDRSCWRGGTSAAARAASTPRGPWRTTASASSWPPASPTSSTTTVSRTACCRSGWTRRRSTTSSAGRRAQPATG